MKFLLTSLILAIPFLLNGQTSIERPMIQGWTWFSINVENTDMGVGTVLNNLTLTDGDYIKSMDQSATYYNSFGWFGDLTEIDVKETYKIKLGLPGSIIFEGDPVDPLSNPILIGEGWNWIGYLPQAPLPLAEALSSLVNVDNDYIKSMTASATYYESFGWFGDLSEMIPLDGFMYKSGTAGTLTYPSTEPVNNPPNLLADITNKYVKPGELVVIDLNIHFSDIETPILDFSLTGLDNGTFDITDGILTITPTPGWLGTDTDIQASASDGEHSTTSNLFSITVSENDISTVTFEFRAVSTDQILSGGTYTMNYKMVGESTVNEAISTEPSFQVVFNRGETYDLQAFWSLSLDTNFDYPGAFVFLKRPGDLEAFEQRTGTDSGDTEAFVTFNETAETIYVYKFLWDFPFTEVYYFVITGPDGQPSGTSKFSVPDIAAPVWWDVNEGLPSTALQMQWVDELFTEITALPQVYSTFPIEESASRPASHHVWIQTKEGNPLDHVTLYDGTHSITEANVTFYPDLGDRGFSLDERNFKLEILKSILNLSDEVGVPPFLEFTGSGYVLSEKAKKIISCLYLAQVGSKLVF